MSKLIRAVSVACVVLGLLLFVGSAVYWVRSMAHEDCMTVSKTGKQQHCLELFRRLPPRYSVAERKTILHYQFDRHIRGLAQAGGFFLAVGLTGLLWLNTVERRSEPPGQG